MILCVTGPMAAGKNYVTALLEKKGFVSIDADVVGHKAVEECREKILETFGSIAEEKKISLTDENGNIIRRNLGALIFGNAELVAKQEQIVYPYITKTIETFIEEHKNQNVIVNATVLYKIPLVKKMDKILYVDVPAIVRFFRARKRDKMKMRQILARFKSQKKLLKCYKETGIPVVKVRNWISSLENLDSIIEL